MAGDLYITERWRREHVSHLFDMLHDALCDDETGNEPLPDTDKVGAQCTAAMELRNKYCGERRPGR